MTLQQIKDEIDRNNRTIETLLNPSQFTLNNAVRELLEKNAELQKACTPEFEGGYCKYCYLKEDK